MSLAFTHYYLDCLSHASYLVGDTNSGRAVVVDPQRDIAGYLADAELAGLTIELAIQTHFHADFLSGHLELQKATGARIVYSNVANPEFDTMLVADGEHYSLGGIDLEFVHTPGHTPESLSVLIHDPAKGTDPWAVLTGDVLFAGDVGRPDLLASIGVTQNELAEQLYSSLETKIKTLPNDTLVFPAHGAGSACGKDLSTERSSTIGEQKATNYALNASDKETFIRLVTVGQPPAPGYFVYDAILDRKNRETLDEDAIPPALTFTEAREFVADGALLLDGRDPEDFARAHLRGSINVGLDGRYAEFAGSIVPSDVDIVLVVTTGLELEAKNRLARIGFDRVVGYVERPLKAMLDNVEQMEIAPRLTAIDYELRQEEFADAQIVDVRNPSEVVFGAMPSSIPIPVGQIPDRISELDQSRTTIVICAGGYRSSVAASLLRNRGFGDVHDIVGGYDAWAEATGLPILV